MSNAPSRINWVTSIFLIASFLVTAIGAPLYIWRFGLTRFDIGLFVFMVLATGMAITTGYHRLYSHRSFSGSWPVRLICLLFGAATFQNSVLLWSSEHRYHHKYTDRDGHPRDPYNINRGFFYAHMGWLFVKEQPQLEKDNVADLRRDPLVVWQDRYILPLAIGIGFLMPAVITASWAAVVGTSIWVGALGGLLIAGCARIVIVQHATFFINSLAHTIGRQPYDSSGSPRDSGLVALFTFGEGYHNFHHTFQNDYRNGVRFWHFDPSKWVIFLLSKVGLADSLRRVPKETIRLAVIREKQRKLEQRVEKGKVELNDQLAALLRDLEERAEKAHLQCRVLFVEYSKLAGQRLEESREKIRQLKREIKAAKREFRNLAREWNLALTQAQAQAA